MALIRLQALRGAQTNSPRTVQLNDEIQALVRKVKARDENIQESSVRVGLVGGGWRWRINRRIPSTTSRRK